jgi:hypothetical protein
MAEPRLVFQTPRVRPHADRRIENRSSHHAMIANEVRQRGKTSSAASSFEF